MKIYLNTAVKNNNYDPDGISEQDNINYIADALEPYLKANGVGYFCKSSINIEKKEMPCAEDFDLTLTFGCGGETAQTCADILYSGGAILFSEILCEKLNSGCRDKQRAAAQLSAAATAQDNPEVVLSAATATCGECARFKSNIHNIARAMGEAIAEYGGKRFIPPEAYEAVPASQFMYGGLTYGEITAAAAIKTEPSANSQTLIGCPRGTQVLVVSGNERGYVGIRYNDKQGFVLAESLDVYNICPDNEARLGVVNSRINIRTQPTITAHIAGVAPSGVNIIILSDNGMFYGVNYKGLTGYAVKSEIDV